jgi:hypothetical protein
VKPLTGPADHATTGTAGTPPAPGATTSAPQPAVGAAALGGPSTTAPGSASTTADGPSAAQPAAAATTWDDAAATGSSTEAAAREPSYLFLESGVVLSGDEAYDLSLDGLRNQLHAIKGADPELFGRMNLRLRRLERRQRASHIAMWSGVGVGMALIVVGGITTGDPGDEDFLGSLPSAMFLGGIAAFGAGVGASMLLDPSRAEMIDHINEHNRTARELSLKIGPGRVGVAGTF